MGGLERRGLTESVWPNAILGALPALCLPVWWIDATRLYFSIMKKFVQFGVDVGVVACVPPHEDAPPPKGGIEEETTQVARSFEQRSDMVREDLETRMGMEETPEEVKKKRGGLSQPTTKRSTRRGCRTRCCCQGPRATTTTPTGDTTSPYVLGRPVG